MTFTEEYLPDEGQELDDIGSYPSAFGITFTPQVSGIACGVLGLLASLYLAMQWVLPTYTEYQKLKAEESDKQAQVEQGESGDANRKYQAVQAQLQEKQGQKLQVMAMFANENSLDTLLLDINRFFKSRGVKLTSFQPQGEPTIINDSSLGENVNNKLKRQSYLVEMEGGFENTQAVIRDLERLQPLIILKGFNSQKIEGQLVGEVDIDNARLIPFATRQVKTSFTMDVIIPLTQEELAKLAPPPPEPEQSPEGEQKPDESKQ